MGQAGFSRELNHIFSLGYYKENKKEMFFPHNIHTS
jgi:hypothetical protein